MNTIVICHSTLKENNIHLIIANETKKEIKTEQKNLMVQFFFDVLTSINDRCLLVHSFAVTGERNTKL